MIPIPRSNHEHEHRKVRTRVEGTLNTKMKIRRKQTCWVNYSNHGIKCAGFLVTANIYSVYKGAKNIFVPVLKEGYS
jgi:hypothetical protein